MTKKALQRDRLTEKGSVFPDAFQLLDQLLLILRKILRQLHLGADVEVPLASLARHAHSRNSEKLTAVGLRRDRQLYRAVERTHPCLATKKSSVEIHRVVVVDIISFPFETFLRSDPYLEIEVSPRSVHSLTSPAPELQPLAVADSGGNLHLDPLAIDSELTGHPLVGISE